MSPPHKRTVLVVLDGFGERRESDANAIRLAATPHIDALYRDYPHTLIDTSGLAVGLPDGQMGNSEVGHMNLGAGRVVYQDLTRIDKAIKDGTFFDNAVLDDAIEARHSRHRAPAPHGPDQPGRRALVAGARLCARRAGEAARARRASRWHAFLDGRDTPPKSAAGYLREMRPRLPAHRRRHDRAA